MLAPNGDAVGVITVLFPEQIVGLLTDKIETVGVVFTTIVLVTVFALTHPATLVPLIVYVVVELGETVKLVPVKAPGFNVYTLAPVGVAVGVMTVELFEQIVGLLTDKIETVGVVLTVIVVVAELALTHPAALVPVIV